MSADRYQASAGASDPASWNRYAYTGGDPINRMDKTGRYWCSVGNGESTETVWCEDVTLDSPGEEQTNQSSPPGDLTNAQKKIKGVVSAWTALSAPGNEGCAKFLGAGSVNAAVGQINTISINPASLAFSANATADGGYQWDAVFGFSPGDGTIQQNNNAALSDLTHVLMGKDANGTAVYANILADFEGVYGLKAGSVNSEMFWAIYDLHELGHIDKGLANDNNNPSLSRSNTQNVIDNCFAGLKAR